MFLIVAVFYNFSERLKIAEENCTAKLFEEKEFKALVYLYGILVAVVFVLELVKFPALLLFLPIIVAIPFVVID